MSYLVPVLGFVFVFGLVVLVHELGHFLFAKTGNVQVDTFSIGMGPSLFSFTYGETTYKIASLPLGGYVSMAGEDPEEAGENPRALYNKSVGTRLVILLAGCLFNFLLGYLIFVGTGMSIGEVKLPPKVGSVSETIEVATGEKLENGKTQTVPAPAYGKLKIGDRILSINGERVNQWQDIQVQNQLVGESSRIVRIARDGRRLSFEINPVKKRGKRLGQPRYVMGIAPFISNKLGFVKEGSTGEKKGFKEGDRIVAVEGKPVKSWIQFQERIRNHRGEISVTLKRKGERFQRSLRVPEEEQAFKHWVKSLGLAPPRDRQYYGFFESFSYGLNRTMEIVELMYETVVALLNQQISPQSLAGPVGIAHMTGQVSRRGIASLLYFTAFFSINLGVINLLPVPALDGGHVLLVLPELLTGSALPERVISTVNYFGMVFLLGFILYVTKIDLCRYEFFTQYFGVICQ